MRSKVAAEKLKIFTYHFVLFKDVMTKVFIRLPQINALA